MDTSVVYICCLCFFFFKQKTAYEMRISDWSSDVCSSDLVNPTFTGPRVEAILGYDHTGAGSSVDNDNDRDDQSIAGLLYGVGAGYDVNLGRAVVGVEGESTDSTAKSGRSDPTNQVGFGRVQPGPDISGGGRAGGPA